MRKAIITKSKFFTKGEDVLIKEMPIGKNNFRYVAIRETAPDIEYKVIASEFEYIEDVEFTVSVTRVAYAHRNIVVKAKTRKEAEEMAIDEAGSLEFIEHTSEYESGGAYLKEELE